MKDEWNNQLGNGRNVHYSIEPSAEPILTITAQARDSVVLHQASVREPISREAVEAYFRFDLMKEPDVRSGRDADAAKKESGS